MIGWLSGKVVHTGNNFVILDVDGVGYKVYLASSQFPVLSSQIELHIHHHVREDINDLYGFETPEALAFFELLLEVPGVGPKMAMNIMSAGNIEKMRDSIIKSDAAVFTAISGIGQKLAAKIIIELKPKLLRGGTVDVSRLGEASQELVDALTSLGYNRSEITKVLSAMPVSLNTTQQQVTWALKHLNNG